MAKPAVTYGPLHGLGIVPLPMVTYGPLHSLGVTPVAARTYGPRDDLGLADVVVVRVNTFNQRLTASGDPAGIGDLIGKIYGGGVYDGVGLTLVKVEKAPLYAGPYTPVTVRTSDPAHVFPATAVAAGSDYNLVIDPDEFVDSGFWLKLTVKPDGIPNVDDANWFSWNPNSYPEQPAFVTVPASSASGDFQVTWPAADGATYYKIQEGIEDESGITWGDITNVGNQLFYDAVDKAGDTTYWYRVLAGNGLGNESPYTPSTNGCRVERPAFKISPDLGWSNRDALFSEAQNDKLAVFPLDELATTEEEPQYVKNRNNLIFTEGGVNYIIPGEQIDKFGANGLHYWRYMSDPISTFMLSRNSLPVEGTEKVRAPDNVQPRIIG